MDSLKGAKLLKADGSSVEADNALQGKVYIMKIITYKIDHLTSNFRI